MGLFLLHLGLLTGLLLEFYYITFFLGFFFVFVSLMAVAVFFYQLKSFSYVQK